MSEGKAQEKLVARLRAVAKQEGNRVCADCTDKVRASERACVRACVRACGRAGGCRPGPPLSGCSVPSGLWLTLGVARAADGLQFPGQICLDFNTLVRRTPRCARRKLRRGAACPGVRRLTRARGRYA